jgi:hypothetical protein
MAGALWAVAVCRTRPLLQPGPELVFDLVRRGIRMQSSEPLPLHCDASFPKVQGDTETLNQR